ncbi:class I SAM-dependent DNA methyltransferase [Kurthia sibirica]|uniref:SAM-dependent methyltransferase n=1 Tax=Kurthia sibirica TaxID=202750 RepID=A0A2U3AJW6_9BACL|nr:class I SAM-dependent methyltransferase [Kurthia sibirica]PWI24838.1 SAM-dependent methyltransferase [Kurthia sibirica]GEK33314.1 putative methyltransferase YqeM [Kurthia sibirica]
MTNYGRFAEVYDVLMQDIPYDDYVQWVMKHAPAADSTNLLDIGCGTGTMLEKFMANGYIGTGLDLSEEMLMMANERLNTQGQQVLLVCQSMDELEGFVDLDIITIPIDSINYLPERQQVEKTLKGCYDALASGGQLFFDVHSLYKMSTIFMDGPFTYDDGDITYLWQTADGEAPYSVHHDMSFFVHVEDDLYERFEEQHYQRTFSIADYTEMVKAAGFEEIQITADFTDEAPSEFSQRIFFHATK